jgi:midasin (ATPase involved in ribosome maturation)
VRRAYIPLLLIFLLIPLLFACDGNEAGSSAGGSEQRQENGAEERTKEDNAKDERAERGGQRQESEDAADHREVVLELTGEEGASFSGTCEVGDEKETVEGTVPQRYDYRLEGHELRCEIENKSAAPLKAEITAGNTHYTQQTSAEGATLNFVLSGDAFASSTSSVTAVETSTPDASSSASSRVVVGTPDAER